MGDVDAHVCDGGDSWISPDYTCWNWGSEIFLAGDNLQLRLAYNGNKMDGDKPMANGADACLKILARRTTSKKHLKKSEMSIYTIRFNSSEFFMKLRCMPSNS